jgi:hypothetical protein
LNFSIFGSLLELTEITRAQVGVVGVTPRTLCSWVLVVVY